MNYPTTYQDALQRHPEAVQNALECLRMSKSKYRKEPPENLNWLYSICVQVRAMSFSEVVAEMGKPRPVLSPASELNDLLARTHCVLVCTPPNGSIHYGHTKVPPPQVYIDNNRQDIDDRHRDRHRFEALTKGQQNQEVNSLLKELSKDSGFRMIRIPR